MRQSKQRVFGGDTHAAEKLVSIFEPTIEIIRKGKASKPTEFGKMVKIQEAENQIITDYEMYDERPSDSDLLIDAIEIHQQRPGCTPRLAAADAAFYSAKNEDAAHEKGVTRVCVPNRSTKSAARKRSKRSAGSNKVRNGGPAAKDGSAFSSVGTAYGAAFIKGMPGCGGGLAGAGSPII